ncbi:DMT family transporter [Candidatus Dependentiae bacterium]
MYLIGVRMILAGLGLLAFWYFREGRKNGFKFGLILQEGADSSASWVHDIFGFLKVAFFHVYLAFVPEFWAMQYIDSLKVTLLFSATPFLSALFSRIILSERLSLIKWIAMFVGFCGIIPSLFTNGGISLEAFASVGFVSIPEFVLLISIVSAAYAWFEVKVLLAKGYHIFLINGVGMFLGGLASTAHHFAVNPFSQILPVKAVWPFLILVVILILLSNVIFYNLYGFLLHRYTYTFLSFTGFLCPIFGTIFGITFFGEAFHWLYVLGFAMTFTGLWMFYRMEA